MKKIGKKDALMMCLNEITSSVMAEDEFTKADIIKQSIANGKEISEAQATVTMSRLISAKKVTKRKVLVDGRWTNAYRML